MTENCGVAALAKALGIAPAKLKKDAVLFGWSYGDSMSPWQLIAIAARNGAAFEFKKLKKRIMLGECHRRTKLPMIVMTRDHAVFLHNGRSSDRTDIKTRVRAIMVLKNGAGHGR